MKQLLAFIFITTQAINSTSQKVIDVDKQTVNATAFNFVYTVAGVPFVNAKFSRVVEGSPFFNEQMMKGAIILSEGREYRNVMVRINLLESQVNYINEKQIELVATTPIREVVLWDTVNNRDHRFVYSNYIETAEPPEKDFYEILQAGKAELYKQYKKQLLETRPYGSATVEQTIQTEISYFLLKEKKWAKIKKLKDLVSLFKDKSTEISKFISDNTIAGDNEANFQRLVAYYNSLLIQQ